MTAFFTNVYEVLGISNKADIIQIQESYDQKRRLALEKLAIDTTGTLQKEINRLDAAYRILHCEERRAEYDVFLKKINWVRKLNTFRQFVFIPTPTQVSVAVLLMVTGVKFFHIG